MTMTDWRDLVVTTITDPAQAARRLLSLNLGRDVLWMALVAAALINTVLLFAPSLILRQPVLLPSFLGAPLGYAAAVSGGLIAMIWAVYWIGGLMGGAGRLEDVAVALIWLQIVRDLVQVVVLVLQFVLPVGAVALVFAASLYSIYVLLHFINAAHELGSLGRSAGVLVLSILGVIIVMSVLLTLIGGGTFGDPSSYV